MYVRAFYTYEISWETAGRHVQTLARFLVGSFGSSPTGPRWTDDVVRTHTESPESKTEGLGLPRKAAREEVRWRSLFHSR